MSAHGRGFRLGDSEWGIDDMTGRLDVLDQQKAMAAVVNDYYWDAAPTPVVIPYTWISPPVRFRADQPINDPAITVAGSSGAAHAFNATSVSRYGDYGQPVTLTTAVAADADSLASWYSANYADFRMRCPSLTINLLSGLLQSTDVQKVLGVKIGDRLVISNAPATWPQGTNTLFVEGIDKQMLIDRCRYITFNTSPVIGTNPGTPGPYFRWGSSTWGSSTDLIPF